MLKTNTQHKIKAFFQKYTYTLIIGITIMAVAITIALTLSSGNDNVLDVGTKPIEFTSPVANGSIYKDFSATELQYNEALKQWEIHKAIDYVGESSTQVLSAYEGTVKNVYTDYLNGTVIEIEHSGGLKTIYKSLDNEVRVAINDKVQKGTVLGVMSTSMAKESTGTPLLHFEVQLNGLLVDPNTYLNTTNK